MKKHRLTFEMKNEYKIKIFTKYLRQNTIITRLTGVVFLEFYFVIFYYICWEFSPQSFYFNYITVHGKIKNKKTICVHLSECWDFQIEVFIYLFLLYLQFLFVNASFRKLQEFVHNLKPIHLLFLPQQYS